MLVHIPFTVRWRQQNSYFCPAPSAHTLSHADLEVEHAAARILQPLCCDQHAQLQHRQANHRRHLSAGCTCTHTQTNTLGLATFSIPSSCCLPCFTPTNRVSHKHRAKQARRRCTRADRLGPQTRPICGANQCAVSRLTLLSCWPIQPRMAPATCSGSSPACCWLVPACHAVRAVSATMLSSRGVTPTHTTSFKAACNPGTHNQHTCMRVRQASLTRQPGGHRS